MAETRRTFVRRIAKTAALAAGGGALYVWGYRRLRSPRPPRALSLEELAPRFARPAAGEFPELVVARDRAIGDERGGAVDPAVLEGQLARALSALGGMRRFVRPGSSVLVKPNVAFATNPRLGAVTEPALIAAVVRQAIAAGAGSVVVCDNPIASAELAFDRTGVRRAVEAAGGRVRIPYAAGFRPVRVPGAAVLSEPTIFFDIFEAVDVVIGIAPVKDHNLSTASLTMKNWYGLLGGQRSQYHQHIHEVICDLWRLVRPAAPLLVLDGTRALIRNGPTGGSPADVVVRNALAVGTDPVAIDAFGVTLLDRDPAKVPYLVQAQDAGFGSLDYKRSWREV